LIIELGFNKDFLLWWLLIGLFVMGFANVLAGIFQTEIEYRTRRGGVEIGVGLIYLIIAIICVVTS
jgi:hypothetical protein